MGLRKRRKEEEQAERVRIEQQFKSKLKSELKAELKVDIYPIVEKLCKELVFELFTDMPFSDRVHLGYGRYQEIRTVKGNIKDSILGFVKEEINTICANQTEAHIDGEVFLDSIIDRIKRKQL